MEPLLGLPVLQLDREQTRRLHLTTRQTIVGPDGPDLPLRAVAAEAATAYSAHRFPMSTPQRARVAIVDDDEELCRSFGRLLRAAGFQAVAHLSAEAFLADLEHPPFDCLVIDIELGGMSGIDLAERLVGDGCPTPFIYITAHDDPMVRARAEASGAAAYFRKTDSGADVLAAIRKCVGARGSGQV